MFRNYLEIAIRNLWRLRVVSAINVFGLALGISASVIIFQFIESGVYYTDSSFFDFFPILKGDGARMLTETYSVAISDQIAEKYFGKEWQKMPDLLDRTIILNSMDDHGLMPFNITGVFAAESNSHFQPDILLSYSTLTKSIDEIYGTGFGLGWFAFYTYFLIHPNSNAGEVRQEIEKWFDRIWSGAAENRIS